MSFNYMHQNSSCDQHCFQAIWMCTCTPNSEGWIAKWGTQVQCLLPVVDYTRRMGSVDRFDQIRSCFSVSRRSFKWWTRIFYFLLDSAVVNTQVLFNSCRVYRKISQFNFRATLSKELFHNFCSRWQRVSLEGGCYVRRQSDHAATLTKKSSVPDSIQLQAVENTGQLRQAFSDVVQFQNKKPPL